MNDYTEYEKLGKMFTDEFLDLMIEKNVIISDELINYLFTFNDRKENFEKQITKSLKSKNINEDGLKLLLDIYENEAKKHKEEQKDINNQVNNNVEIIEKNAVNISLEEKRKKEIANIKITDVTDVDYKNHQLDLFILQFPVFALKHDNKSTTFKFKNRQDVEITLRSNDLGRATIQDSDIWLYCISKMMQLIYEKKEYTRRIQFTGYDFLKRTGRAINTGNYKQILKSLQRLEGTSLQASQKVENLNIDSSYGLIDGFTFIRDENNKKIGIEVVLPQWLYQELVDKDVLKINPDYFGLTPLEKRIYHLAKCSCYFDVRINEFINIKYNLDYFVKKIGSKLEVKHFRNQIKKLVQTQPLPEYVIIYDNDKDQVRFEFKDNNQNQLLENKEKQRKLEAKDLREKIEKTKEKKKPENIEKDLQLIRKSLQDFEGKKYPIFQTKILTDEKLREYLREFDVDYLSEKIRGFIDFDFKKEDIKNPEGYFYGVLKNGLNQMNLPFGDE